MLTYKFVFTIKILLINVLILKVLITQQKVELSIFTKNVLTKIVHQTI